MGDVGTWSLPPALGDHLAEARQHSAVCRNRIVELFAAPKTKRPCRCASRVSPRRGRLYVWAFQASPPCLVQLYIMAKLTTWASSVPNSETLQVRFAQTAQGTADFAASLVIVREQKELTSSLTLTAPAADAGASFIRRVGTTSARLGLALWDGRPNPPIPRTRSPSPSPGCVSCRGFVF
jgi:hypothetical protein